MSHPLTDDIIAEIAHSGYIDDYCQYHYVENDLRAAADWQLEQVIAWLDDTDCDDPQETAQRLKQAMRPTTTQEDN